MPVTATFRPQGWFRTPIAPAWIATSCACAITAPMENRSGRLAGSCTRTARSGYIARTGLFRVLAWPWLFKNFAVRDLAEFLEIYGLPLRLGTYNPNTSDDKARATLCAL